MSSFGRRLRSERRARDWSVKTLSELSGVPMSTLYELEKGRTPRDETLTRLAKAFRRDPAELDEWAQVAA